jgi:lipopolysaccharide transport system ATP-binding protein
MSDIAILVEKLGKRYRIGQSTNRYRTLRDTLAAPFCRRASAPPSGIPKRISNSNSISSVAPLRNDEIWALQDVSFEVKRGEVVGIIGRNGAGKSTLLKILSRITEPTAGYAEIRGRGGSLLDVGIGFHAELTGRENIYLNGAILGMKKAEIERRFDEIVGFAELGKFIDTPLKHYSNGMYVRLAFAVAAHLEPDILLIDEVLAVGDSSFQKKCLGKMKGLAKEGRTVLYISHQMASIKSLCSRAIQIHSGSLVQDGQPEVVINHYLVEEGKGLTPERVWGDPKTRPGNDQFGLMAIRTQNESGQVQKVYESSEAITVEMEFEMHLHHPALFVGFALFDQNHVLVFQACHNHGHETEWPTLKRGVNKLQCIIPRNLLNNGIYSISPRVGLNFGGWIIFNEIEVNFEIQMNHCESSFWNGSHNIAFPGVIVPFLSWRAVDPC